MDILDIRPGSAAAHASRRARAAAARAVTRPSSASWRTPPPLASARHRLARPSHATESHQPSLPPAASAHPSHPPTTRPLAEVVASYHAALPSLPTAANAHPSRPPPTTTRPLAEAVASCHAAPARRGCPLARRRRPPARRQSCRRWALARAHGAQPPAVHALWLRRLAAYRSRGAPPSSRRRARRQAMPALAARCAPSGPSARLWSAWPLHRRRRTCFPSPLAPLERRVSPLIAKTSSSLLAASATAEPSEERAHG